MSNLTIPADQWLKEQFAHNYCEECGGDRRAELAQIINDTPK